MPLAPTRALDPFNRNPRNFPVGFGGSGGFPVDMLLTFEAGTAGDIITVAYLAANQLGAAWSWTLSRTPLQHTKVGAFNRTIQSPVTIGGASETGSGTRGLLFDLAEAVSLGTGSEGMQGVPPLNPSNLTLTGRSQFNATTSGDLSVDCFAIQGGSYCNLQHGIGTGVINGGSAGVLRIESQISGATIKFGGVPIDVSTWYRWYIRYHGTAGTAELLVFNDQTNTFIGAVFTGPCDILGGVVDDVLIQDYLTGWNGGNYMHDNVAADYTHAAFPLEPFTLPAPPTLTVSQTAANQVTLSWNTSVKGVFKIEREITGSGSWSTLQSALLLFASQPQIYVDSTVSNNVAYTYRITSIVSDLSSSSTSSSSITINNSTAPVVSDNFDSYISSDYLGQADSNWTPIDDFVNIANPTGIDGAVIGSGNGNGSLAVSRATFTANHRSEAEARLVGNSFCLISVGVRGQSANTAYHFQIDGSIYLLIAEVAGVGTVLSNSSLSVANGDRFSLEASGTGSATRLKAQHFTGGAWVDVLTNVDPGIGNYIDGGSPGVGGRFGGATTALLDNWAGYNV